MGRPKCLGATHVHQFMYPSLLSSLFASREALHQISFVGEEALQQTGDMNTDITSAAKPEYPVVDRNPPFTKTVANFNTLDYLRLSTLTGISVVVGYLSGIKPGIRGPSMVTGGLIGGMGGFMYAYQNSAGRLMGFFPNEGEVAKYKKK